MKPFILASQSPRRKQLLEQAGLSFTVIPSQMNEHFNLNVSPEEAVAQLAGDKARSILEKYPDQIVLGADTVIAIDGEILGKPADRADAEAMLRRFSGRTHDVITGVALVSAAKETVFAARTEVTFFPLTDDEINEYIESGEPFDKAGAYGIQGLGATLVEGISGDYYAVVGLPLARVFRELRAFNAR
ncbi:Maf family protein [Salisediminibacterium halotolerans]|uniref:Maf family protein n=1 Tax=Salisediminibacterium halotolerans TaxID=517425 RepID=UPI000EB068C4|nr:Maf family protein [Salisediminibacterium halotolerans]RLJ78224.1 septum formation protein [Actinophytocola xinjiangensis]RPE88437.1 septum formation protein [Salisediminibacterium halotolerans]TWG37201.1 septum formation protein [Salisediminibacterium halotolerans]GEL07135.1 septum formation protein Maf [Salisediminibacterium halotolerans]